MRRGHGFTLIELLVALAIFALLALLAYSGLNNMLTTQSQSEQRAEALRELQLAYKTLERDLEQIVPRDITDEFGQTRASLTMGDSIDYLLEVTRGGWRNPADQARSTLQRVAFALEDKKLIRYSWLTLDRPYDATPRKQDLLTGITDLQIRILDASGTWQQRWPIPNSNVNVVNAIELTLKTELWGELRWLFRVV